MPGTRVPPSAGPSVNLDPGIHLKSANGGLKARRFSLRHIFLCGLGCLHAESLNTPNAANPSIGSGYSLGASADGSG